jgi:hypothetical protein
MAIIHHGATVVPSKLELLTGWLPSRPWYAGGTRPDLVKAGGFRLDDPAGEVGLEFLVVTEGAATYHVPLTYRAAPLAGADDALVGTAEHSVLGRRWVYDGPSDPVLVATLLALINGDARPQAQSKTDTPDDTVTHRSGDTARIDDPACEIAADGPNGTDIRVAPGRLLRVRRRLQAGGDLPAGVAGVTARWQEPDGGTARDVFAVLLAT